MSERSDKIAELYYRSRTIKFGSFKLSIHKDHPELPDSPWYLHFPKSGESGTEFMPELHSLIGEEFHDILESQDPPVRPSRITGLPKGALPLGDALARHYPRYPRNLIKFAKIEHPDGGLEFGPPEGEYLKGEELQPVEDHISGARNNKIFLAHARNQGFVVTRLLVIVDRQQGGPENMAAEGVKVIPIFTGDELLQYGVAHGHITQAIYEQVQEYRANNQFGLAGLN